MIVLKEARIDDYWKDFVRRNYSVRLIELRALNHEIFDQLPVRLLGGVNIFVGRNGVGKSNLMRLIYNCLIAEGSNRVAFDTPIINKAHVELDLEINGCIVTKGGGDVLAEIGEPAPHIVTSFMFDPCTLIPLFQQMLLEQSNLAELVEQHGQNIATEEELKVINYLTGNDYSEVVVTTIEGEFESYPAFPYFSVRLANVQYDSSSMGMGELSLFYFWWLSSYMARVESKKVLLVEEPESFLPPASQERLANLIAMTSATQGTSLVLSTHSEHILRRMPPSKMHLVLRTEDGIRSYPVFEGMVSHMDSLGLVAPKLGMLFLEDVGGLIFAKALFNKASDFSVDNFYYHNSGSESEITTDIKRLVPAQKGWLFVGLYDGDCRSSNIDTCGGKHFFLPSTKAPDELMMGYFKTKPSLEISEQLRESHARIHQAKSDAAGTDFHDYFHTVARVLRMDFNRLFTSVCEMWIDDNPNALESFVKEVKEILR